MPDFVEPNDFLCRSTILRAVASHRVAFDPSKRAHCASLKKFLETGNWGEVMFYPEYPYTDVPTYVLAKFACHHLKAERRTAAQRQLDESRERVKVKEGDDLSELIEIAQQ